MGANEQRSDGFFPIARERADVPFERFRERYYRTEQPVIIEGVAADWPARGKWTAAYLQQVLSKEPSAVAAALWYWVDKGAMEYDYAAPDIVERIYDTGECFPRSKNVRIWVHSGGNVTPWHYDVNMVNIFYVQITGRKDWWLLSPETPPRCYPFSYYAIIDGRDEEMLRDKTYTRFTLNEGDMLYVPPCWFHKVVSQEAENISLNWAMTNRSTEVASETLARELEIYAIQSYFTGHRSALVRKLFDRFYFAVPDYLRYKWQHDEPIESPCSHSASDLWKRVFRELAAFGPTLLHSGKAYAAIRQLQPVRRLAMQPGQG